MQYTPPIAKPPDDAEVIDDWYLFWALAKRLDVPLDFCGTRLATSVPPSTDELLALVLRDAQVPFEEIKRHPHGRIFDLGKPQVAPATAGNTARFEVIPDDVATELAAVATALSEPVVASKFPYLLASRRMRDAMNSVHHQAPSVRRRLPNNPLYVHPDDMAELGVEEGGRVEIHSEVGRIDAIAVADLTVRRGVVQMSHCFGGLPNEALSFEQAGACTNLLVSTDRDCETINAMPRQSGIPVRLQRAARSA
jgi:anaerobic selenocysteine-containing dehydrogenase